MTEEQGKYITDQDWKGIEESVNHNSRAKYALGDLVIDENGYHGVVGIQWNDGDFSASENDSVHPNPKMED